jgi:tetratricopeptide (TPR) repeat protein
MELRDRAIALYGRFSGHARERLTQAIEAAGGAVARDLTRRSDALVVGALATTLIDSGALAARIAAARARGAPVLGERAFEAALSGEAQPTPTVPLATALAGAGLSEADAEVLAAFDLIALADGCTGFGDQAALRTAGELRAAGRSLSEAVRILARARDLAPRGRRRIVLTPGGEAALQWADGLTSLEGQGLLPLDDDHASLDDLFEAAALAEADGDLAQAARLYDLCARADRGDPIALYNLGNIRLGEADYAQAALAYRQALARDAGLSEARYNLAQALEADGKDAEAVQELERLIAAEPAHADGLFNLAQLRLKAGEAAAAKALYERFLALGPAEDWASVARQAVRYCASLAANPPA